MQWGMQRTDGGGTCIDAVLNQLFANRDQVDNDLARLDLVDGAALDGLDGSHVSPWPWALQP